MVENHRSLAFASDAFIIYSAGAGSNNADDGGGREMEIHIDEDHKHPLFTIEWEV